MRKKKQLIIFSLIFSLILPLTVFTILDDTGAFDRRSSAQNVLFEDFQPADLSRNGEVGIEDFKAWVEEYRAFKSDRGAYTRTADLDSDGAISLSDFSEWLDKWRGFKEYKKDPQGYLSANYPEGLVAGWSLDQHVGSGSYLEDGSDNGYNAKPVGTQLFSNGVFGAARLMAEGDTITVENGEELPLGTEDSVVSMWMSLLDNDLFNLGDNPDAFLWNESTGEFEIAPVGGLDADLTDLIAQFEDIDIEGMMEGGSKGWFNWMALTKPEENSTEYYVNGVSVAKFDSSSLTGRNLLMLLPDGNTTAVDSVNVWEGNDVNQVYESRYTTNVDTPEDYQPYVYSQINDDTSEDATKPWEDPNYSYTIRGYESRTCIICSDKYEGLMAHFNVLGEEKAYISDDLMCEYGLMEWGDYSVEPGTLYYTCASTGRCGGLSEGYQITGYPDQVTSGSQKPQTTGVNTRAEYLECIDNIIARSTRTEEEESRFKQCSACSSRYSYIVAYWNGTCNESTDAERIKVDPNLIYKCRRCGSPDSDDACVTGGIPSETDEMFARHYDNSFTFQSSYTSYMEHCIEDRDGCPELEVNNSTTDCHRCSNTYKYAYAKWSDPGADNKCFTDDDPFDKATYTCDCTCSANSVAIPTNQWVDSKTYEQCKTSCGYVAPE